MKQDDYKFKWKDIGDIKIGRPNLGNDINVFIYRLMQYTMRCVLNNELGGKAAAELFYKAGFVAGKEFCLNLLNKNQDFYLFIAQLQKTLKDLRIGILRIEETDLENLNFTIVIAEDLDCSGLLITEETVCDYDEGFIAGVLHEYSGKEFTVKEIDCWSTGERVCRFKIYLKQ